MRSAEVHDKRVAKHDPDGLSIPDAERAHLERLSAVGGVACLGRAGQRPGEDDSE
jgi:hypothetical protein